MYEHETRWNHEDRIIPPVLFPAKAPDLYPAARAYLESRVVDPDTAFRYNWYPAQYRGPRLIIPCNRTDGIWWQGRLLDNVANDTTLKRWDSPQGYKGDAIVLLESREADRLDTLVVVEGPIDALAAVDYVRCAVATLGAHPSIAVLRRVVELASKYARLLLVADRDSLGQWVKWQSLLGKLGVTSTVVEPTEKDLAAMGREERRTLLGAS